MRWWFQTSNHEVKIVILAKFDDEQHHILLEKWEEEISIPQGAIMRSRAAPISQQNGVLNPVKRQSITIIRDETTNPVSYNVTRGALVLGFRLLFLRDPARKREILYLALRACSSMQRMSGLSYRDQTSQSEININDLA
ncbi:hypothetical protein B0T26DRAFT_795046, partial [Lasiosphaeria miniovina]